MKQTKVNDLFECYQCKGVFRNKLDPKEAVKEHKSLFHKDFDPEDADLIPLCSVCYVEARDEFIKQN